MTKSQAIALYNSGFWEEMTDREIAAFQLHEERLCIPFDRFHEAITKALGRPVFTHEFGLNRERLMQELAGDCPAPSTSEVIGLIPEKYRVLILTPTPQSEAER